MITATNAKPITGPANMDITIVEGDASSVVRTTSVTDAHGRWEATAKLANGKMAQTSFAHGQFHFDNLHAQGDAKTVTTVDLDRVK